MTDNGMNARIVATTLLLVMGAQARRLSLPRNFLFREMRFRGPDQLEGEAGLKRPGMEFVAKSGERLMKRA
jgi:hypothetical protein